jgi:hypothetical protein
MYFKNIIKKYYYVAMWHFVMGYNIVPNNGCKLYIDGQWMMLYILTIYIIHVKCDEITLNLHL